MANEDVSILKGESTALQPAQTFTEEEMRRSKTLPSCSWNKNCRFKPAIYPIPRECGVKILKAFLSHRLSWSAAE
jgi:hypothetical protein